MNITSPLDSSGQADIALLQAIFLALTKYTWSVPVAFGIPGNIMTMLVANRKHNRKLSPCIYMTAMAVADSVFLLEAMWFYSLFYPGLLDDSLNKRARGLVTTFHVYFISTSGMISGLFLAAMSIDRLIAVRFPMAAVRLCTTKRAKWTVILSAVPIIAVNVHIFYIYEYIEDLDSGVRVLLYNVPLEFEKAASLFNIIIGTVFPFAIIFGSNLLIILTLRRASKERTMLQTTQADSQTKQQKNTQHLTVMLIFVSVAYIMLSLPYRIYDPITQIPEVTAIYDMSQLYWRLRYGIWTYAVVNVWFYNYAVNFYLYCVGGGRRYRNDTKEVIGQLFPCCFVKNTQTGLELSQVSRT